MWKAFGELEELGWIGSERPRMVAVQAEGAHPYWKPSERGLRVWRSSPMHTRLRVVSGFPSPTLESRYCVCYVRVGVPLLV